MEVELIIYAAMLFVIAFGGYNIYRNKNPKNKFIGRHPSTVVNGEELILNVYGGTFGGITCRSNNPQEEKMYVRITFMDGKTIVDKVFSYHGSEFENFSTLNPVKRTGPVKEKFEDELKVLLSQERFEEAAVLRDAINKLAEVNAKNKSKK